MSNKTGAIDQALDTILQHEGGYQVMREDRGNYTSSGKLVGTNYGVSAKVLEEELGREPTAEDMKNLTEESARNIYLRQYVRPVTNNLGIPPDAEEFPHVLDMVINHGYGNTVPILQRAVGAKVDGKSGPGTRKAIQSKLGSLKEPLVEKRKEFYSQIVKQDPDQKKFLKGWLSRADSFK